MKLFPRSTLHASSALILFSLTASMCGPKVTATPALAPEAAERLAFAEIRERAVESTVRVISENQTPLVSGVTRRETVGAGIVIAAGPLVLTANHLVRDTIGVKIRFPMRDDTARDIPMRIVRASEEKDVVLLEPVDRNIAIAMLPIARSIPSPGDSIWFYGQASSMSSGTVIDDAAVMSPRGRLLSTDAVSTNGDSGAPCMNERGELVGILILGNGGPHAHFVRIDDAIAVLGLRPVH